MFALSDTLQRRFAALKSTADFWALRHVQEGRESYWVRRRVAQAPSFSLDGGAMLTVRIAGVEAYAATSDIRVRLSRIDVNIAAGQRHCIPAVTEQHFSTASFSQAGSVDPAPRFNSVNSPPRRITLRRSASSW